MQSSCRAGRWDRSSAFLAGLIPLMPRATTSGIMPTIKPGTRSLATGMLSSPGSRRTFLAAGPTLSPRMWLRRSEGATEHPSELKVSYNPTEMMTIAAARTLRDSDICFVGIGMPSAACNLARLTHAPGITLIYESGTIATKPDVLPLSIGDGELCDTALTTVSVPEMFRYWLQGERFTVGRPDRSFRQSQYDCGGLLRQAEDPAPRRRRRAGDIQRLRRNLHHHAPGAPQLRAAARLRHIVRSWGGRRPPRTPRYQEQGADQAYYRSRGV